ncbi:L-rhamnose mutarotase [Mycolicibacterium flavescens]|uniref:L-rhamnose mutarotase n=1 Tax=Mycolicibacterium flavescens TaxID=1776 RepID=A0A1E3RH05_MYCFV|nr:L-rhamnose mutarotase [Mycolicibacterium flavescens]MCV7283101.1 L-rhamnose mutarotase [Mycolicibacterium flavescens]ODQ89148.1 L-rhamnose mutarotase [Mycolicibacterium flavescens]
MGITAATHRVCFLLQLRPDRVEDYLDAHDVVWPEMLDALRAAGWRNYSLFLRPDDGLVVGYLETDDFDAARQRMAATDVNDRWQAHMAQYFQSGANPDQAMKPLAEYFHLD